MLLNQYTHLTSALNIVQDPYDLFNGLLSPSSAKAATALLYDRLQYGRAVAAEFGLGREISHRHMRQAEPPGYTPKIQDMTEFTFQRAVLKIIHDADNGIFKFTIHKNDRTIKLQDLSVKDLEQLVERHADLARMPLKVFQTAKIYFESCPDNELSVLYLKALESTWNKGGTFDPFAANSLRADDENKILGDLITRIAAVRELARRLPGVLDHALKYDPSLPRRCLSSLILNPAADYCEQSIFYQLKHKLLVGILNFCPDKLIKGKLIHAASKIETYESAWLVQEGSAWVSALIISNLR